MWLEWTYHYVLDSFTEMVDNKFSLIIWQSYIISENISTNMWNYYANGLPLFKKKIVYTKIVEFFKLMTKNRLWFS